MNLNVFAMLLNGVMHIVMVRLNLTQTLRVIFNVVYSRANYTI